VRGDGAAASTL